MIRQDCLSKCRRDRAYCHCKSDVIHVFSDVIHVSILLIIRLFLAFFGFSKPIFWRRVHKCGTPSLAKSFLPVLCWQSRRERVRPRHSDAWQSGRRRGTRFCFCLMLLLAFLQLSLQRYRRSTTALTLRQGNRAAGSADFRRRFRRWSYA